MIIFGAAAGVARALEKGLRDRILHMITVHDSEDPEGTKRKLRRVAPDEVE